MKKVENIKELVDFAYNKYKAKKVCTIEKEYIKDINYFNFRFDVYSMARALQSKISPSKSVVALISENRYEFWIAYIANVMINNMVILIDGSLSKDKIEKTLKKYNVEIIFFSDINREKVIDIVKISKRKLNLINFDSNSKFPIIGYEKIINVGRYIENNSIDNINKETEEAKNTIIVSLGGEKKFSEKELIETASIVSKNMKIKRKKKINFFDDTDSLYKIVIGLIIPLLQGLSVIYAKNNSLLKNDIIVTEENNKNITVLYRKNKYLIENYGQSTSVIKIENNLLKRKIKKENPNFVLIKSDKKNVEKVNNRQAMV